MQAAVSAASWVVGKALAPVTDGLLEAWASSAGLGPNVDALKVELLYVQAMLENAQGREIRGPALKELLHKLRQLAYSAEDVLDELEYFRIQDELDGTYEATDVDARGAIRDAALNVRPHTAKLAVLKQLGRLCSCSREQRDDNAAVGKFFPSCSSAPPAQAAGSHADDSDSDSDMMDPITWPPNDNQNENNAGGGVRKIGSCARHTARAVGKFFPCCSSAPPDPNPFMPAPKLEFPRVEISKRMKDIVDELKPLCTKVSTILNLDPLDSNRSIVQDIAAALLTDRGHTPFFLPKNIPKGRPTTTSEISEPKFYGRHKETAKIIHDITNGLDIIHSDGNQNKSIEDIGLQYLMDLVDHGFFKEDEIDGSPFYIIHDLLHDLGLKVASHECLSMDHANMGSMEIWPSVRHLSIIVNGADDSDGIIARNFISGLSILKKKLKIEKLRTLMVFGKRDESFTDFLSGFITKANGLRVLHLSCWCPRMEFSALTHLRYLRLGMIHNSPRTHLPCILSRFYHLRILDLREWMGSPGLPRDMSNLTKLRHFTTRFDIHHSNIFNVGKLQLLQELKRFEVKKEISGFDLNQLGSLVDLRELGIYNLWKVHTKEEAAEAQLIDKIYLHKLTMDWHDLTKTWGWYDWCRNERDVEGVVLETLQPGRNLQELRISGHGGRSCPTWLGSNLSVKALQSLDIESADWEALPWLGHMPVLHKLTLKYVCNLKEFGPSYFGSITEQSFRNLNKLKLIGLYGLEQWSLGDTSHLFSQLQVLIVGHCPELLGLPFTEHICHPPTQDEEAKRHYWFPNLQTLKIFHCPKVMLLPPIPWTRTLSSASIIDVPLLESLHYFTPPVFSKLTLKVTGKHELHSLGEVLAFSNLADLQDLEIIDCPPLEPKHLQMLTSLEKLEVKSDHVFVPSERVGEGQCQVPVETLVIRSDHATGKEVSQLLSHLSNLSSLIIYSSSRKVTRLGVQVDQKQTAPHGQEQITLKLKVGEKEKIEQDGLLLLPAHLSGCLRMLDIVFFPELSLVASSLVDHHEAGDDIGGAAGGLQALRCLKQLIVDMCPKFLSAYGTFSSSSASCCFPFPSSLENLYLKHSMGMATLEPLPLSNLTSLTKLQISYCGEDFRGEGLWTLLTHGQLTNLTVFGCPKFFLDLDHLVRAVPDLEDQDQLLQLCSPKLRELTTDDIAAVLTTPICKLLSCSLAELVLHGDQGVERFTKEQEQALQLLISLQELGFWFHYGKLQCLPAGLDRLPSLNRIDIKFCPAITSLPKDGLPISLQELKVLRNGNSEELEQHCRNFVREHPRIKLI
ncbi:unnamed protein product [Urochloa decumbens]|uniref:Rx N-terminal domain-containing protein n=1 Tax=Urochloa decumbens TaxID=240449 RepID=A0ABC9CZD7_9POAL